MGDWGGWEGAGGPDESGRRLTETRSPFYIHTYSFLEKHLPLKMLFSEAFQTLVIYNVPAVSNRKAMAQQFGLC